MNGRTRKVVKRLCCKENRRRTSLEARIQKYKFNETVLFLKLHYTFIVSQLATEHRLNINEYK